MQRWWTQHTSGSGEDGRKRDRREALLLLRGGLCALCRDRAQAERRWLAYFVAENHTDAAVLARLEACAGFCPAHTRLLLENSSAPWLMPQVAQVALAGAEHLLSGTGPQARCPLCQSLAEGTERSIHTLLRALDQEEVRETLTAEPVLCLPHTLALAARARPGEHRRLLDAALKHLAAPDAGLDLVAGEDPDAAARTRRSRNLDPLLDAEPDIAARSAGGRWEADTALACCPVCLAEQRAVRRLLCWQARDRDPTTRASGQETELCAGHLHDLTAVGGPRVDEIVGVNGQRARTDLTRHLDRGGTGADLTRHLDRGGTGADLTRHLDRGGTGADLAAVQPHCRACAEEERAGLREYALAAAALTDPLRARRFEHAHGLCLHHVLTWPGGTPPPTSVAVVLRARLALLGWEIDEALRKQDWRTRHEVRGSETSAGLRAPALLDGRVYAGLPAPDATG
ncbi:hypothetical protein [Kitasatospora sp. NPDC098663]|uniref:hypothetical protein n=1 Tax=Kitasatospora sp. NPDC098663 TaxID=3364096 RepID=UPI003820F445